MERVRKADALTVAGFHALLRAFVAEADPLERIGDVSRFSGTPWLWARHHDQYFHLNADTTAEGAAAYLELVDNATGGRFDWFIVPNQRGKLNKVAFGDPPSPIPGFYFYRADPSPT